MKVRKLINKIYQRLNLKYKDENIERLTFEQMKFITQGRNRNCFLEACPGSGKTEVVGLKAAYELNNWKGHFTGIAIVSFTKTAAKEIKERVRKYAGIKATSHPHFIGTFDSFFYNFILYPFFYKQVNFQGINNDFSPRAIIDEKSDAEFSKNKKYQAGTKFAVRNGRKLFGIPIPANKFYFDLRKKEFFILPPIKNAKKFISLSDLLKKPEQIEFLRPYYSLWLTLEKIKNGFWKAKQNFWQDGFLTFKDSEFIIYKIFETIPEILKKFSKRFPIIIIDECQDLSPVQLMILQKLVNEGVVLLFIGDLNQAIFKFREVKPELVEDFIKRNNLKKLKLTNNFRSNQSIVNTFSKIFPAKIKGNEQNYLQDKLVLIEYKENEIPKLITRYKELINEANVEAQEEIIKIENSAIIIRGSSLLNKFKPFKTETNNSITLLAISIHLWNLPNKNSETLRIALSYFGFFISKTFYKNEGDSINYYCIKTVSNTEWRIFLSSLLSRLSKSFFPFFDDNMNPFTFSELTKRIKTFVPKIISELPVEPYLEVENIKLNTERGLANESINKYVSNFQIKDKIRITTIHSVKGETLDSALIVSSSDGRSRGGHWKDWFNDHPESDDEFEHKRYGYVAFSRPKHLLVLATPQLNSGERQFFEDIGFKIENL